jgi:MFS family permease
MTLTLVGDVVLGIILTMIADRIGRRKIILSGSLLMVMSGAVFVWFENFWILLAAAVIGVISTSGGDFGPFRAIEEYVNSFRFIEHMLTCHRSMLSQLTTPTSRADVLSWYITLSTLGSSLGSEVTGRMLEYLRNLEGWKLTDAYHALFLSYVIMGLLNAVLIFFLTKECEAEQEPEQQYSQLGQHEDDNPSSAAPGRIEGLNRIAEPIGDTSQQNTWWSYVTSFLADISRETLVICYKLWALLALDSLADGMVPYSFANYYVDIKFKPSKTTLGDMTSIAYLLSTVGTIFAGPLARKIGLINTMVFTHVPSSAAVLCFPFPDALWFTILLLFVRSGLNNMDQAPRTAFIAAVVKPSERTAVMGITTIVRTLGATAGPTITGFLAGSDRFWVAFVAAGVCRLSYDFGLYAMFVNMKLYSHETNYQATPTREDVERDAVEEYEADGVVEDQAKKQTGR